MTCAEEKDITFRCMHFIYQEHFYLPRICTICLLTFPLFVFLVLQNSSISMESLRFFNILKLWVNKYYVVRVDYRGLGIFEGATWYVRKG